jgi:FtsP/CotA-like multicopper oxidase with cupredoxin domain
VAAPRAGIAVALLLLGAADTANRGPGDSAGTLAVTLEASPQTLHFGGAAVDGMTYNGDYAGPVLRVRPGERLQVDLINHLAEPTNLHFHGIKASPLGHGDNVHVVVEPDARFRYDLIIPPDQSPGLYWYHAHLHGLSEGQIRGGLSGAIVVEGLAERFPELAGLGEDLFVLKDIEYDESTDPIIEDQFHELIQSINGSTMIEKRLRPGETRLWRFGNQSANLYFHLGVAGHKFRVVAEDGIAVQNAIDLDRLDIKPAARLEVLVTGGAPGVYDLVSYGVPTGAGAAFSPNRVLGHVTVDGAPAPPIALPIPASPAADLSDRTIDAVRRFEFSQSLDGERFFIDGRLYDHDRMDVRVPLGHVEEWTIRNASDDLHVFHIHQVSFQIVEINGRKQPFNGQVDIARVPERGEIKIRLAFTDPRIVGRFVFHCHVLKHEDKGMMANIEVYDPAAGGLFHRFQALLERARLAVLGLPAALCGRPG